MALQPTPENTISHSQLHDYLLCHYRWYLRYGLSIRPIEKTRSMDLGIAVHAGLAHFFKGATIGEGLLEWQNEATKGIPILDDSLEERMQDILGAAQIIIDRTLHDFRDRKLLIVEDEDGPIIERPITVPLMSQDQSYDTGMFATGILDVLTFDPTDRTYWIADFKVRGTFQDDVSEEVSLQNAMYQYMAKSALGIPTVGTLTYQISSKLPTKPRINKDGTMSRARIATDWPTYREALIANNLDPSDYEAEMLPKLDAEFVRVTRGYRSQDYIDNIWTYIVTPAAVGIRKARQQIAQYQDEPDTLEMYLTRNLSQRSCNGCTVRSLCLGQLHGYDVLGILNAEYQYKAERAVPILAPV